MTIQDIPGVVGDGRHDDAAGLQALFDRQSGVVSLPPPPVCYCIRATLRLHSGQTLQLDRSTTVRLADQANVEMLTNADHDRGNQGITVNGGIWDGNNAQQTRGDLYAREWRADNYIGVALQFRNVTDLTIRSLTLKDPESFGMQLGQIRRFTVEDITFDYNLLRKNMDGVHLNGLCSQGRLANLKGTTNDDLVALNADDVGGCEMTRGPISDIVVDSIFSDDCWTAVRLLSHGSPIRRIKLANLFGTFRYNLVSFTNYRVHPGEPSIFDDICLDGVFCSKSAKNYQAPMWPGLALIWLDAPATVSHLTIRDYHRTETALPATDLYIEQGATVENLIVDGATVVNHCAQPIDFLHNRGTIGNLSLADVQVRAEITAAAGLVVRNEGTIAQYHPWNVTNNGTATAP